jgi:hypothetical protein
MVLKKHFDTWDSGTYWDRMEEPIRFVRRAIAGFSPLKVDGRRNPLYDSLIRRSECQTCHATCMSDDMFDPLARKSRDA